MCCEARFTAAEARSCVGGLLENRLFRGAGTAGGSVCSEESRGEVISIGFFGTSFVLIPSFF